MGLSFDENKRKKARKLPGSVKASQTGGLFSRKKVKESSDVETEIDEVGAPGDDEILASKKASVKHTSDIPAEQIEQEAVCRVGSFQGGFVNPALEGAVNTSWRKSTEANLLLAAMEEALVVDGLFVGSIYAKASFVQKTGGGMLL